MKLKSLLMTILLFLIPVSVLALSLAGSPIFQAFDGDGGPLSGGFLYTYEVGSTTEKATYQDKDSTAAHTNPIILDSRGESEIWWNGSYKLVLKDSSDTTIWTVDNFQGSGIYIDSAASSVSGYIAISHLSGTSEIRFVSAISGNSITAGTLNITNAELPDPITPEIATTSTITGRSKDITLPLGTYTTLTISGVTGIFISAVSDSGVTPTSGASCVLSSPDKAGYDAVFILRNQTSIAGTSIYVAFTAGDNIESADTILAGTSKFIMSGTTDAQQIWCHSTGVSKWFVRTTGSPSVDWD